MNEFYIYTATVDRSSWKVSLKRRRFISSLNRLYLVWLERMEEHKLCSALHLMRMFIPPRLLRSIAEILLFMQNKTKALVHGELRYRRQKL